MRKWTVAAGLAGAVAMLAMAPSAGAVNATYDFSSGNQGWGIAQNNAAIPTPADSLGSYIAGQDTSSDAGCPNDPCNLLYFVSPGTPAPLAANYGGTISFDLASNQLPGFAPIVYIDSVVATAPELQRTIPISVTTSFQHLSVPLTEAGWSYCQFLPAYTCTPATQAQFRSVLASAIYTDVLADLVSGTGEVYSLDNFKITEPAPQTNKKKKRKCKKAKKKRGKRAGAAAKKKRKCKKRKGKKRRRSLSATASSPH